MRRKLDRNDKLTKWHWRYNQRAKARQGPSPLDSVLFGLHVEQTSPVGDCDSLGAAQHV